MIFQDPMTTLDPTIPIGKQIAEAIRSHNKKMPVKEVKKRVIELMELVGIDNPTERMKLYPYNFSGGMRQRSVMAIALACNPKILLADEPTTALDVTIQAQILDLLKEIQCKLGTATILVSHDLGVVAQVADRVAIMYAGKIVEIGTAEEIYHDPRHPYTLGLLKSLPALSKEKERLHTIPGMPPTLINPPKGDAFAYRNPYALAIDYVEEPPMFSVTETHYVASWLEDKRAPKVEYKKEQVKESSIFHDEHKHKESRVQDNNFLIDVKHLSHYFRLNKKFVIKAVDDVSFQIKKGEIFGLVGESGSGKSTVARCIMNIYKPTNGTILFEGINIWDKKEYRNNRKKLEKNRQMIFQDSASSLNQRMKVIDIIAEPMRIQHRMSTHGSFQAEVVEQLKYVGLDESYLSKFPPELSGGQRQRVSIARALSMEPDLLIADEPIASLDVSIQAQIVNLFKHLQGEHGFSILFIAHDLAMVEFLCDRIGVMYHGKLVEVAETKELFKNPKHPYTKSLLSAIPVPDPKIKKSRKRMLSENHSSLQTEEMLVEAASIQHVAMEKEEN